jgi:uncharacterized protein (DUF488 family)
MNRQSYQFGRQRKTTQHYQYYDQFNRYILCKIPLLLKTTMNIYTLGYESFTLETFVTRLKNAGVKRVIDVREIPISRKKGFSKRALSAALDEAGIAYTHIKLLGCPKPVRDRLKKDGNWTVYAKAYLQHLDKQTAALDELLALAVVEPVGLLCFEADYKHCHRSLVARAAIEVSPELEIMHLTPKTAIPEPKLRRAA